MTQTSKLRAQHTPGVPGNHLVCASSRCSPSSCAVLRRCRSPSTNAPYGTRHGRAPHKLVAPTVERGHRCQRVPPCRRPRISGPSRVRKATPKGMGISEPDGAIVSIMELPEQEIAGTCARHAGFLRRPLSRAEEGEPMEDSPFRVGIRECRGTQKKCQKLQTHSKGALRG